MKKYRIGYTQGVYDMFHIGHLNLLNAAKQYCDKLIVGVNADALVEKYKGKLPIISEDNRKKIVENIKAVDEAVIVYTLDKVAILKDGIDFDAVFIGSDWKGNPRWVQTEADLNAIGKEVVFLPYTDGISSTELRQNLSAQEKHDRKK